MLALVRLYFISWLRGIVGPFFSFFFPILMLLLLGQFIPFGLVAPTYVAYSAVTLGVHSLSVSLVQFKNSSIIKRIGQTPITKKQFIFSMIAFNVLLIFLATMVTIFAMWLFQKTGIIKTATFVKIPELANNELAFVDKSIDISIIWSKIQWGYVILFGLIAAIFSISVGLALSSVVNTPEKANGFALIIYFILTFLSGIFFPLNQIKNSMTLDWFSIFSPLRPVTEGLTKAFSGDYSIFYTYQFTIGSAGGIATKAYTLGLAGWWLLYPITISILLITIAIIYFKWE